MIGALLAAGANPDATDKIGRTALMWAARWGHCEATAALLAARANSDVKCVDGGTALFYASDFHHVDVEQLLLRHGALYLRPGG